MRLKAAADAKKALAKYEPFLVDSRNFECALPPLSQPARAPCLYSGALFTASLNERSVMNGMQGLERQGQVTWRGSHGEVTGQRAACARDKLYCSLTCQLLGKSVAAVRQHMRGKKFQRAKQRFEADEADLIDEPPLDAKARSAPYLPPSPNTHAYIRALASASQIHSADCDGNVR